MLRDDVAVFVQQLASGEADTPENMGPAESREMYRAMIAAYERPVGELAVDRYVEMACRDGYRMRLRLYDAQPGRTGPSAVILHFHGGGWVIGDVDTHAGLCGEIARQTGLPVLSADYRLAPEHAFPTAHHDGIDAMQWLGASPAELGFPVDGIIPIGDSAGATIAAACVQQAAERGTPDILALGSFYAPFEIDAQGGSIEAFAEGYLLTVAMYEGMRQAYFQAPGDRGTVLASPIFWDGFDKHPPALIYACEYDPLRDQSRAYAAKLAQHGVSVRYREGKGHIHGSVTLRAIIPSGQDELVACCADLMSLVAEARARRALA